MTVGRRRGSAASLLGAATVAVLALGLIGTACAKKKSGSDAGSTDGGSAPTGGGSAGGGVTTTTTDPTQVSIPSTLSLVDSTSSTLSLADAPFALLGTGYDTAATHVQLRMQLASDGSAKTARSILCLLAASNYPSFVGSGPYLAMIDQDRCTEAAKDSSDPSTSTANLTPVLVEAVASSGDVLLSLWLTPNGGGRLIYATGTVTSGPSATNPFGLFSLQYTNDDGSDAGTLSVRPGSDSASVSVQSYEVITKGKPAASIVENGVNALSATLYPVAGLVTSGAYTARVKQDYGTAGAGAGTSGYKNSDVTYSVAFGANRILETATDGTDTCLKQDSVAVQVSRYALFNAADESAVTLASGFPLIDAAGDVGYIGFGGPSPNLAIKTGDTVYKADPKATSGKGTAYTAAVTAGRLWKQTRVSVTLASLKGLPLDIWKGTQHLRVVYDGSNFASVGTYAASADGPVFTAAASSTAYALAAGANSFASPLGPVMVNASSAGSTGSVVQSVSALRRVDVTGSAEALALYCLNHCPSGLITSAAVTGSGSPFTDPTPTLAAMVGYSWTPSTLALTLTTGGTAVALDPGVTSLTGAYASGIESGPLYLASDYQAATRLGDLLSVSTFYTYSVGTQAFDKETLLQETGGDYVAFDPPLAFTYTHATATDANADATYAGLAFQLSYAGYGNLYGIPTTQDPKTGAFVPNLSITSGTLMGPSNAYKILGLSGLVVPDAATKSDCAALDVTQAPALPAAPASILKFLARPVGHWSVLVDDGAAAGS